MTRPLLRIVTLLLGVSCLSGCVVAASSNDSGGSSGGWFLLFLPLIVMMLVASMFRRGRRGGDSRRRLDHAPSDDAGRLQMLRAELSVLADDVLRLEPRVALHEEARDDYEAATHRYKVAQAALDHAAAGLDLARVQRVVDEGTWAMARARALLDGREPPPPPPMLQQPGPRGEPAVQLDHERPVYVDSPMPFRSGWFGMGSGFLGGLLLGPMLGGFGGGWIEESSPDDGFGVSGDDMSDG
jgi:hypothetical protein